MDHKIEHHPRPDITPEQIRHWASNRADDAGALARRIVAEYDREEMFKRLEKLKYKAHEARLGEGDYHSRWSQYHHALQAAYESGELVIRGEA